MYTVTGMLWSVLTTEKVHNQEARRACIYICMTVKQQDDCITDSSDYKPRSSFTSLGLFKFGAQIPCQWDNKLEYDSAYTNKVRLRNFMWTISVMCSYFVYTPACYNYTSDMQMFLNCMVHVQSIYQLPHLQYTLALFTCLTVTVSLKQQHLYTTIIITVHEKHNSSVNNYYSACMKNKTTVKDNESLYLLL